MILNIYLMVAAAGSTWSLALSKTSNFKMATFQVAPPEMFTFSTPEE